MRALVAWERWAVLVALVAVTGAFRWMDAQAWPVVPVPELLVLWAASVAFPGRWPLPARLLAWAAGGLVVTWSLGEAFYRAFYRDHFDLPTDLGLVPGLLDMVSGSSFFRSPGGWLVTAVAVGALVFGLGWLADQAGKIPVSTGLRRPLALGLVAVAAAQLALWPGDSPLPRAVATALTRQVPEVPPPSPVVPSPLEAGTKAKKAPGLWLLVVESYGHTVFTQEDYRRALEPAFRGLEAASARGGWSVKSGFFRSPTFGGRSWLADATLLAGQRITNQAAYDEVVRRHAPNLTHELGSLGYHRVLGAPGTLEADDAWRQTYAFDRYLFDGDFGYRGPAIGGLGRLSDQFLLDRLTREDRTAPVFVMAILVSSHTPFRKLPVYLDGDQLGDGSVYRQPGTLREFDDRRQGYLASLEYVFECVSGFLDRGPGADDVVIVVGDHQPLIPVSEPDSTFSVPLHVLSRDPQRLEGLEPWGLEAGWVPGSRPLPHPGLETVADLIRAVLGLTPKGAVSRG